MKNEYEKIDIYLKIAEARVKLKAISYTIYYMFGIIDAPANGNPNSVFGIYEIDKGV